MRESLTLFRGFGRGWLGDEATVTTTADGIRVVHLESDGGQPVMWSLEVPYQAVQEVALRSPKATLGGTTWGSPGPDAESAVLFLSLTIPGQSRPKELLLEGRLAALQALEREVMAKTGLDRKDALWKG